MSSSPIWNRIRGNWKQIEGSVKQEWGKLTDDDVAQADGEREKLAGKLQDRYGVTQAEANKQIDSWAEKLKF